MHWVTSGDRGKEGRFYVKPKLRGLQNLTKRMYLPCWLAKGPRTPSRIFVKLMIPEGFGNNANVSPAVKILIYYH